MYQMTMCNVRGITRHESLTIMTGRVVDMNQ